MDSVVDPDWQHQKAISRQGAMNSKGRARPGVAQRARWRSIARIGQEGAGSHYQFPSERAVVPGKKPTPNHKANGHGHYGRRGGQCKVYGG